MTDGESDIGSASERVRDVYVSESVNVGSVSLQSTPDTPDFSGRLSLGSGFSGSPGSAANGDLTYDHDIHAARLQTDRGSVIVGKSVEYINGWVTSDDPYVVLGTLPENSVTTGVVVSVPEGFSSTGSGVGFSLYSGFSGIVIGTPSDEDAYGGPLPVDESGPKSMPLNDSFGFIPASTQVVVRYSGFSGFSGITGKANVTVTYIRSSAQP